MTLSPLVGLAVGAGSAVADRFAVRLQQAPSFLQLFQRSGQAAEESTESAPSPASIEQLQRDFAAQLKAFQEQLEQRLADGNVHTSVRIRLEADSQGRVRVAGPHPHADQINQLLAEDGQLQAAFHQLAANHGLLQAAARHQSFAEQYAADPLAATSGAKSVPVGAAETFALVLDDGDVRVA